MLTFVVLSFLVWRVTQFLLKDALIQEPRIALYKRVSGKPRFDDAGNLLPQAMWRQKLLKLIQCFFCLSIWVALATVLVLNPWMNIPVPAVYWIALSGSALLIGTFFPQ